LESITLNVSEMNLGREGLSALLDGMKRLKNVKKLILKAAE
jgi:hypothetical protein